MNTIPNAHHNGVLSCEFDPLKSYTLCTSGMDYFIRFWDIRKTSNGVNLGSLHSNTHWVWNTKYNKTYSRVMISCSSSSMVSAIIFPKEIDENSNLTNYSNPQIVDYIEFEDSVYSIDWCYNDPWTFAAVSYNSNLLINSIPEDIKYKIMLDH